MPICYQVRGSEEKPLLWLYPTHSGREGTRFPNHFDEDLNNMKTMSSFLLYGVVPKGDDGHSNVDKEERQKKDGKPKAKAKKKASPWRTNSMVKEPASKKAKK